MAQQAGCLLHYQVFPTKARYAKHASCKLDKLSRSQHAAIAGFARRRRIPVSRPRAASVHTCCSGEASTPDFADFVQTLQEDICTAAGGLEPEATFITDRWEREGSSGGFGITRVLEGGEVLEKAAVNVSVIKGHLSASRAQAMSSRGREVDPEGGQAYSAAAMSLVFHSRSPRVPTFRADVRHFQVEGGPGWYGGGADLTPYYLYEEDARQFHQHWKAVCDVHGPELYPHYKKWCDSYFYIPARKEHRGVGGIFFDDLQEGPGGPADADPACADPRAFVEAVAAALMPSFLPIAERRAAEAHTEEERQWQLLRRGRYLEFNLLYDRGVRFGLDGGRIESIMVSAPPLIAWKYNVQPQPGSREAQLVDVLREPRDWASSH